MVNVLTHSYSRHLQWSPERDPEENGVSLLFGQGLISDIDDK